jgi:hypothetical protein
MKTRKTLSLAFVALLFSGCALIPTLPKINVGSLSDDQKKSLASVERIDSFPFLSMDYYGDADVSLLRAIRKAGGIKSGACTTFTASNGNDERLLSRNHDWPESPVLILFVHPKKQVCFRFHGRSFDGGIRQEKSIRLVGG